MILNFMFDLNPKYNLSKKKLKKKISKDENKFT